MPPQAPSLFAERLRLLRNRRGWSQVELGKVVSVSQATISEWELGKASPTVPDLVDLCRCFKVSADWMVGISDFEHGLAPDQWIADDDAIAAARANPKRKNITVAFKVPRRMRVLELSEFEALKKELKL